MGLFFSKIKNEISWRIMKVEMAFDRLKNKIAGKKYKSENMEDHIDVDRVLADFRKSIEEDVKVVEKNCMENISEIFDDLKDKTSERFPDLVEIISLEQKKAEQELSGTVMRYVKEHLSKNDTKFLKILEMSPGSAKKEALGRHANMVFEEAEKYFNLKLSKYTKDILNEFTDRLESRINDQQLQLKNQIDNLKNMERQAEKGEIDVDIIKDSGAATMESAGCILSLLEAEM